MSDENEHQGLIDDINYCADPAPTELAKRVLELDKAATPLSVEIRQLCVFAGGVPTPLLTELSDTAKTMQGNTVALATALLELESERDKRNKIARESDGRINRLAASLVKRAGERDEAVARADHARWELADAQKRIADLEYEVEEYGR
jgi:hypothetical protein